MEVCSRLDFAMRSLLFLCEFQFVLDCLLCFQYQLKVTNTALAVVSVSSAGSSQQREHFVRPSRTCSRSDPGPSWDVTCEDKINSQPCYCARVVGARRPRSRFGSEPVRGHHIATTLSTDGATCYAE